MTHNSISTQGPANHITLPTAVPSTNDKTSQPPPSQTAWHGDTHVELKEDDGVFSTLRRTVRSTLRRKHHEPAQPKPQPQSKPVSATRAEILEFKGTCLKAAQNALQSFQTGSSVQHQVSEKFSAHSQQVAADLQSIRPDVSATAQDYKEAKSFKAECKKDLAGIVKFEQGTTPEKAEKTAKKAFNAGYSEVMNSKEWNIIEETFTVNGKQYTSRLIPAGKMCLYGAPTDVFKENYNNKGICSGSTKETAHLPNLWIAQLCDENGEVLFEGVRHAVLSPYGLKEGSMGRAIGADNRAKEALTAALFKDTEKFERALRGETVPLQLTSVSLLTASEIGGLNDEGAMFADQLTAWQNNSGKVVELIVTNRNGEKQTVTVYPEVLPFSLGVNNIALSTPLDFVSGWSSSDEVNEASLKTLIGDLGKGKDIGGWVGDYLKDNPENAEIIQQLTSQIRDIWSQKSHRIDGGDPYKLAVRISYLTEQIGMTPAWNCKSGKDRTGWMDVELKSLRIMIDQNNKVPSPGLPDEAGKAIITTVSQNDGNYKVQEANTGVRGNKIFNDVPVLPKLSIHDRVTAPEDVDKIKGISGLYGS